eukprot:NODE_1010_length_699_cov_840.573846_g788_i0.p1 GENE.NODE_1010_length_699_cov_840.573846_g788_i0~~NODE_1010_length_699_cov_840.573846_g788_i0.p1  ORF type:complete len:210 (+),score=52.67 NODE_1010_length_699_cov_840.573846_g788_i0:35-631(+)
MGERRQRPPREDTVDEVESALDSELELLTVSLHQMMDHTRQVDADIQETSQTVADLAEDMANKRKARELDEICLRLLDDQPDVLKTPESDVRQRSKERCKAERRERQKFLAKERAEHRIPTAVTQHLDTKVWGASLRGIPASELARTCSWSTKGSPYKSPPPPKAKEMPVWMKYSSPRASSKRSSTKAVSPKSTKEVK